MEVIGGSLNMVGSLLLLVHFFLSMMLVNLESTSMFLFPLVVMVGVHLHISSLEYWDMSPIAIHDGYYYFVTLVMINLMCWIDLKVS